MDYDAISAKGAEVLAVSDDDLSMASYAVEALGLEFPILYDTELAVIRGYEVFNLNGTGRTTPATFIVDKQGVIRWKYIGRNYSDRPSNGRIIDELGKLN